MSSEPLEEKPIPTDDNEHTKPPASEPIPVMTDYDHMCKESNKIPKLHNILAYFFTWILLAGFIVFPGTFTRLRTATSLTTEAGRAGQVVQAAVQNVQLIYIAAICCFVGAAGMCRLWWIWDRNYEWLLNHIFMWGVLFLQICASLTGQGQGYLIRSLASLRRLSMCILHRMGYGPLLH